MTSEPKFVVTDDTGYTMICTAGKPGCMQRHGGPVEGERWLEFKPCPKCVEFSRRDRLKVYYGKDYNNY